MGVDADATYVEASNPCTNKNAETTQESTGPKTLKKKRLRNPQVSGTIQLFIRMRLLGEKSYGHALRVSLPLARTHAKLVP